MFRLSKIFLVVLLATFYCCSPDDNRRIIGVKVYNPDNHVEDLIHEWKDLGINTVFAGIDLYSDSEFREQCRKSHLRSFIIFPVFFDPTALKKDSSLYAITDDGHIAVQDWVQFVCPSKSEFRAAKIDYAKRLVKDLKPDGISIDFIRHFAYWEKIYYDIASESLINSCFDSDCMSKFKSDNNINTPDSIGSPEEHSGWILSNHKEKWVKWKCNLITNMVADLSKTLREINPQLLINIHIVPWRQKDFNGAIKSVTGQDISSLANYSDYLSPMTYSHMLKQTPSWIHEVVVDMNNETKHNILPSIQVSKAYLDRPMSNSDFESALASALKPPSLGVILWSWEHLDQNEEKKQIFKRIIRDQSE